MFITAKDQQARAVNTATTQMRSGQPIDFRQFHEELAEMDQRLQMETELTKAQRAYDILEVILKQMDCAAGYGCVLSPGIQFLIYRAFDKAGYFTPNVQLDTTRIMEDPQAEMALRERPLPYVITGEAYKSLMQEQCSSMLQELSKKYNIAFLILASTKHGGEGVGPWWCKGNLFSYMLYLKYKVLGSENRPLVIADPTIANANSVAGSLNTYDFGKPKPLLFVIALDGVYTGTEAQACARWWQFRGKITEARCIIITPVADVPVALFENPIFCLSGNETAKMCNAMLRDAMAQAKKGIVPLLVAKCVSGTQSFVLPFKIADFHSLGAYSFILKRQNSNFVPPYRKNPMCDDLLHSMMTEEEQSDVSKWKLENIDKEIVGKIYMKNYKRKVDSWAREKLRKPPTTIDKKRITPSAFSSEMRL